MQPRSSSASSQRLCVLKTKHTHSSTEGYAYLYECSCILRPSVCTLAPQLSLLNVSWVICSLIQETWRAHDWGLVSFESLVQITHNIKFAFTAPRVARYLSMAGVTLIKAFLNSCVDIVDTHMRTHTCYLVSCSPDSSSSERFKITDSYCQFILCLSGGGLNDKVSLRFSKLEKWELFHCGNDFIMNSPAAFSQTLTHQ